MYKKLIAILWILYPFFIRSQIDSAKLTVYSIMEHRNKYIGKSMSVLLKDIKYPYYFKLPRKAGSRRLGISYYYEDDIELQLQDTFPSYTLTFKLNNKFPVNLKDLWELDNTNMSNRIKYLLRKQIIVSLNVKVMK